MRGKSIAVTTLVAGTLDILSAVVIASARGKPVDAMLQRVASGPLGDWPLAQGWRGASAGLVVHYALMTIMVAAFALAAPRLPRLGRFRLAYGVGYGALLYLIMYWIVVPLRWPGTARATNGLVGIALPLAVHILLVGVPIALILGARVRRHRE